jgi:hypothetical protein
MLNAAMGGKRVGLMAGDDDVIEYLYVNQGASRPQCLGEQPIRSAGLGHARRMVMGEDDTCCIDFQGTADNLAGIYRGLCQGAAKEFFGDNQTIARVEKECREYFEGPIAQPQF